MSSDFAISLRGVGKAYHVYKRPEDRLKQMLFGRFGRHYEQSYWALQDVDLEIRRGETIGLIGRNGAGKSTLLEVICGTLTPSCGDVTVRGRIAAMIELGAGFNPDFTGRENARLSATVLGLSSAQIEARLPSIIEFAGIGDFIDQPIKLYSSGMYARLAFAVAAHVDADILVVDEILSVGDAAFGQKCMRFISEFKKKGTLLFVSHDIGAVVNLCDRAVWFERGGIRASGPAKEVTELYLAATQVEADDGDGFRIDAGKERRVGRATDFRHSLHSEPILHSEIIVSDFDPDAPWFGSAGAQIVAVDFVGMDDQRLSRLAGGLMVKLAIRCRASAPLRNALVGFQILDELGQVVLSQNTHQTYQNRPVIVAAGQTVVATFDFEVPYLRSGLYSMVVAVSDGTQADHVNHQWITDAIFLKVIGSTAVRGLLGIPMRSIEVMSE